MKSFKIDGCNTCPFLLEFEKEAYCRMDIDEDNKIGATFKMDLDMLDDVPTLCPMRGGMELRLDPELDQEVWPELSKDENDDQWVPFMEIVSDEFESEDEIEIKE